MRYIYIFVNPESGGRNAWQFIEPSVEVVEFTRPTPLNVHIYSIFDGETGNKPGFLNLKKFLENEEPKDLVLVVTAGGDGTLTWVVSEVEKHRIDPDRLAFGIIPYGTGNDFARSVKWDKYRNFKPFIDNLRPLRCYFNRVLKSTYVRHDFWTVLLRVHPDGKFNKINSKTRHNEDLYDNSGNLKKVMKFMMGNYFSLGTESRVGRGFDRHRTNYSCFNKVRYGIEAFKKTMMGLVYVNSQVDRMVTGEDFEEVVFTTTMPQAGASQDGEAEEAKSWPVLAKSASLVAGNIPSFSSGIDPFASRKLGLYNLSKEKQDELVAADQEMGDKNLEFYTYRSMKDVGLDMMKMERARRVHVGKGPWKILFKKLRPDEKCYFQVDGEFFVMYQPMEVEIKHYKTINVLK